MSDCGQDEQSSTPSRERMTILAKIFRQGVLSLRLKCPKRETVHSSPSWEYTGLNLRHHTPLYNTMNKAIR